MNELTSLQKQNSLLWPGLVLVVGTAVAIGLWGSRLADLLIGFVGALIVLPFLLLGIWTSWLRLWTLFVVPLIPYGAGVVYLSWFVPENLGFTGAFTVGVVTDMGIVTYIFLLLAILISFRVLRPLQSWWVAVPLIAGIIPVFVWWISAN